MTAARWLSLALPLLAVLAVGARERDRSGRAAGLLAFLAAAIGIAALHEVARLAGWYAFAPVDGAYRGMPVDLWIGWAALWGPLPVLLRRVLPLPVALGLLLWIDAVAMPALHPLVRLGPHWLVGEVVGLLAVALPAQLLGRFCADRRHLAARTLLQVGVFTALLLWFLPSLAFEFGDGSWAGLTGLGRTGLLVVAQLALLAATPALAAVAEFAVRGGGTPYPWDPPRRLVTTGPYAYLANPMQLTAVVLLLCTAAVTRSVTLVLGGGVGGGVRSGRGRAARTPRPADAVRRLVAVVPAAGARLVASLAAVLLRVARGALAGRRLRTLRGHLADVGPAASGRAADTTGPGTRTRAVAGGVRGRRRSHGTGGGRRRPRARTRPPRLGGGRLDPTAARGHLAGPTGHRCDDRTAAPGPPERRVMSDTKQRLLDGAIAAIREHGIAGVSARTIAAAAGVNQALVFYHFGTVDDLLSAACRASTAERVEHWSARLTSAGSLRDLLAVGRALHEEERQLGNVTFLAQMLAGAQADQRMAAPTAGALQLWVDEIEAVLRRLLAGSPFAEVADVPGLARAVSAAFIGLELYDGVDPAGADQAMAALDQLALLLEIVDDLGPIARRALQAKVNRATRRD